MSRRRGKPDANQAPIVTILRQRGCKVVDLSGVGGGVPDLLVQRPDGKICLVEIISRG